MRIRGFDFRGFGLNCGFRGLDCIVVMELVFVISVVISHARPSERSADNQIIHHAHIYCMLLVGHWLTAQVDGH